MPDHKVRNKVPRGKGASPRRGSLSSSGSDRDERNDIGHGALVEEKQGASQQFIAAETTQSDDDSKDFVDTVDKGVPSNNAGYTAEEESDKFSANSPAKLFRKALKDLNDHRLDIKPLNAVTLTMLEDLKSLNAPPEAARIAEYEAAHQNNLKQLDAYEQRIETVIGLIRRSDMKSNYRKLQKEALKHKTAHLDLHQQVELRLTALKEMALHAENKVTSAPPIPARPADMNSRMAALTNATPAQSIIPTVALDASHQADKVPVAELVGLPNRETYKLLNQVPQVRTNPIPTAELLQEVATSVPEQNAEQREALVSAIEKFAETAGYQVVKGQMSSYVDRNRPTVYKIQKDKVDLVTVENNPAKAQVVMKASKSEDSIVALVKMLAMTTTPPQKLVHPIDPPTQAKLVKVLTELQSKTEYAGKLQMVDTKGQPLLKTTPVYKENIKPNATGP